MKKIYLIRVTSSIDWDKYDAVIVVAKTPKEAKEYVLNNNYYGMTKDNIICELIGIANKRQPFGEVIASFNAG